MFGAILKAIHSFFKKGMVFGRSIYVKKVMKLLAFIFEQPSYLWRHIAKMYIHACMCTHINVHMKTHVHAPKCSYSHACMHACTHICMHACPCRYIKTFIYLHSYMKIKASALYDIEFRESDVSPGRTEVKQGKFVGYIFPTKGYFGEANKSQNINPISPTHKFIFGIIQIKVKSLSTSFQWLVQYKINLCV